MKKVSFSVCLGFVRLAAFSLAFVLFCGSAKAQGVLEKWPLLKVKVYPPLGAFGPSFSATGVNPAAMVFTSATTFGSPTTPANQGLRLKPANSLPWPTNPTPTDPTYSLDFPLSSVASPARDLILTGLTLVDSFPTLKSAAGTTISIAPYYQIDGAGAWIPLAAPQSISLSATTDVSYGTINIPFYYNSKFKSGHTYDVRLYVFSTNGAAKDDYFYLNNVIINGNTQLATTPTTVTTGTPTASGKYTGVGIGTYSSGATFQNPTIAGVTWSTTNNPSIATSPYTTDGANGTINASNSSNITGLSAGTTYYVRAYAVTPLDTLYGAPLSFTTAAPSKPSLTTVAATNVLSNKATSGGNNIDSGGIAITQKGVCWSTTSGTESATVGNSFTSDGTGSASFTSIINSLQPSTTYYVKAYAKNSLGVGYDNNEITFTTGAAVPYLSAIASSLSFGTAVLNAPSTVLSFKLSGAYFTSSSGAITVTPPTGFAVSTSSNSGFVTTPLSVPFSGGAISTRIFVKLITTSYGNFTGNILLSGGGAVNPNIDTVTVTGSVTPDPNVLNNTGTDFWTGFAYENDMQAGENGKKDSVSLSLYISAGTSAATVVVDLPLFTAAQKAKFGFPRTVNVPADSVVAVTYFPQGDPADGLNAAGLPDSRLYYTGITNRGIHIYSTNNVPVSVWMHIYTPDNSAGAAMLFPTNTWNSSYTVQAYGGESNESNPNSFFYVIANEDSTQITFTPSVDIIDSSKATLFVDGGYTNADTKYPAGITDTIILNKGQIFNAMGFIQGQGTSKSGGNGNGLDLSGTTISTSCDKKIAVFAGNGRVLDNILTCAINKNSSGSDNMFQQMFPQVAWGTKYLSVPIKTMEYNLFRITVSDPTTKVWINVPGDVGNAAHNAPGSVYTQNWNATGLYYEFESNQPSKFESDKPINVTQFIIEGDCKDNTVGNNGAQDPEMIILSPVQQSINRTTVYAAPITTAGTNYSVPGVSKGNAASYINVVIPKAGVASFKLDSATNPTQMVDTGQSSFTVNAAYGFAKKIPITNAFVQDIADTNYYWAKFMVTMPAAHTLSSSVPFNAICYGLGSGVSWGYNAGTAIKNLTAIFTTNTPFGTAPSATTCKSNNTGINISLPYPPKQVKSMEWIASSDSSVFAISKDTSVLTPDTTGSFVSDGATYYTYKSPIQYRFDSVGTFKFTVVAYGSFTSQCGGSQTFNQVMTVVRDTTDFSFASVSCGSNQYNFTDLTKPVPGDAVTKWQWTFYDKIFDSIGSSQAADTSYTFPSKAIYQVKLRTISSIGCFSDTTKTVSLLGGTVAQFTATPDTLCLGTSVSFDGSASNSSYGTISSYNWDFNDGTKLTTTVPTVSHNYTTSGSYKATLSVLTATGCTSNTDTVPVFIASIPKPSFIFGGICLGSPGNNVSTVFTNTSDTAKGLVPYTYLWYFGDSTNNIPNTSTATNGVNIYTPPVPKSGYVVKLIATNKYGCVDSISQTVTTIYDKPTASFTPSKAVACKDDIVKFTSTSTANNQTISSLYWDYGDGQNLSGNNPIVTHKYDSVGLLTVRLAVISSPGGCLSDTVTQTISIHPLPVPSFILPSSCLVQGQSVTFTDNSTIANNYPTPPDKIVSWSWNFNDASNPVGSALQNGKHLFTSPNPGTYNVTETDTTNIGCYASDTIAYIIDGSKPIPGFEIVSSQLCSNLPIQIIDTSRIGVGKITEVQIVWDVLNNPSIVSTDNTPSNGATGSSKTYSNTYPDSTINETYTIKLIASTGSTCLDSTSQKITVFGRPIVTFTASPSSICANASPVVFTGATETNGPSGVFSYSGSGVSNASFNPSKASVGSNTIQAMFTTANGCKDSANSTITVLPVDNISFNIKSDTLQVCKTDIITLNPSSNSQNYYWSESDSLVRNTFVTSKTSKSTQVLPIDDSTTYYVTVNASSCPTTDSIKIYASPYPNVSIVSPVALNSNHIHDTTICYNGKATLTVSTTNGATFVWSNGSSLSDNTAPSTIATPLDSTEYIVTATGSKYCGKQVYDTAIVNVLKPFNINTRVGNDTSLNVVPGESIRLHAFVVDTSFHTPLAYSWSPTTYLDIADTSSPLLTPNTTFGGSNDSLVYTVTATTAQGCPADTTITIHFYNLIDIFVPTAFNPNSNNPKNRVLTAVPVGITQFQFFRVFNRYGNLVFSTTQLGNGWDGTINGSTADIGTYIWETQGLDYNNKLVKRTGTVVLIR